MIGSVDGLVEHLFRHEAGKLVSGLARRLGAEHFDIAVESVQDALVKALKQWPFQGAPENPAGWLSQVAYNLALDRLRRRATFTRVQADVAEIVASDVGVEDEWAVVNAISNGDVGRALKELGRRMERGDSPHALVGQLRWWVSNRLVEGDPNRVRAAIDALLRTDLALKSSGGEDRVLLERLIVELTGRPMASRGWGGR